MDLSKGLVLLDAFLGNHIVISCFSSILGLTALCCDTWSRMEEGEKMAYQCSVQQVIVIARVLGIYGSKPTRVRGRSPRTRAVYVAINP